MKALASHERHCGRASPESKVATHNGGMSTLCSQFRDLCAWKRPRHVLARKSTSQDQHVARDLTVLAVHRATSCAVAELPDVLEGMSIRTSLALLDDKLDELPLVRVALATVDVANLALLRSLDDVMSHEGRDVAACASRCHADGMQSLQVALKFLLVFLVHLVEQHCSEVDARVLGSCRPLGSLGAATGQCSSRSLHQNNLKGRSNDGLRKCRLGNCRNSLSQNGYGLATMPYLLGLLGESGGRPPYGGRPPIWG